MSQYGNISQLSAGNLFGAQGGALTEAFVARESIKFGMCAFGYKGDVDSAMNIHLDKTVLTYTADFTAGNAVTIDITVNGLSIPQDTFDTDHATTMANLDLAIKALNSEWIVTYATRVFTIITPGETADASSVVTGTTPPTASQVQSQSEEMVVLGPVLKAQKAPTSVALSNEGYSDGEALEVLVDGYGVVIVDDIANVSVNTPVYVIKTGADAGKFTGTVGSNLLINAAFAFIANGAQNLAVIRIDNMKKAVS